MCECCKATSDKGQMEEILRAEAIGHVAMASDGEVYIVPLNYAYVEDRVLFHCALEGKKLDMIRANPEVCFEVSRQEGHPAPHENPSCDTPFESVICWGVARTVDDLDERQEVLNHVQARYDTPEEPRPPVSRARVEGCGAVEIRITRMTGRKWGPKEKISLAWDAADAG